MRHRLRSMVAHSLCWIAVLSMRGVAATGPVGTACYSTPSAAVDSFKAGSSPSPVSEGGGYRVTGVQSDRVLGNRWAIVVSCGHTEWPVLAIQTHGSDLVAPSQTNKRGVISIRSLPVVHAGDVVRLWKQEDRLRIEVAGVSEESGGLGKTIRVRLLRRNADDQGIPERLSGIVRGPSDVEIQP